MQAGGSTNLMDQFLRSYIDDVFQKYDKDKSGSLDAQEMTYFWKDLFQKLGMPSNITLQDSQAAIKSIDLDGNGTIEKDELFRAFKMIAAQNAAMQQKIQASQYRPHNPYGGYHSMQPPHSYPQYPPQYNPYTPPFNPYSNTYSGPQYQQPPSQYWQQPQYNDPMMGHINNPYAHNQAKGNQGNQQQQPMTDSKKSSGGS